MPLIISLYLLDDFYQLSPQPSLLEAEQSQVPQPPLTGPMFQPPHDLREPLLNLLHFIHVSLALGRPNLDAMF